MYSNEERGDYSDCPAAASFGVGEEMERRRVDALRLIERAG